MENQHELLQKLFLEAFPNPDRVGCPDDYALQALAEAWPAPNDPLLRHVSSCSECYREYRPYRLQHAGFEAGQQ